MLHRCVSTLITLSIVLELSSSALPTLLKGLAYLPMKTLTITLFTEVMTEWIGPEESDQRVQLSNSVLQRCTGETPLVLRIERKSSFGGIGRSFFDIVRFIENHPTFVSYV